MKTLSLQQVKEDVLSIEKKLSSVFIQKLVWEDEYIVPNVYLSKNSISSQKDVDFDLHRFEMHLGSLYNSYLSSFPQEENKFRTYKKYYDKHKSSIR
jgi:hypothetical protein